MKTPKTEIRLLWKVLHFVSEMDELFLVSDLSIGENEFVFRWSKSTFLPDLKTVYTKFLDYVIPLYISYGCICLVYDLSQRMSDI